MEKKIHPGKVSIHNCPPFPKEKYMRKEISKNFEIKSPTYKGNPVFNAQK